jgi:alpha-galactosidase
MQIRKIVFFNFLFWIYLFPATSLAQFTQRLDGVVDVSKWIQNSFAKGKVPPFSFVYKSVSSTSFISKWDYKAQKMQTEDDELIKYLFTYTDKLSGMQVKCTVNGYKELQAVEWVLNFTNISSVNSGILEKVNVLDLSVNHKGSGDFKLLHANGSNATRADFNPRLTSLEIGKQQYFSPAGGRSSDESAFPFFNLESPNKTGVVLGIGWTGTWFADFIQKEEKTVGISAGMKKLRLYLKPGETIRTPSINMLFWQGDDRMVGNNKLRQYILKHHSRKIDGKFAEYPLSGGFEWGDPPPCNEYGCLTEEFAVAMIKRHQQFGIVPEVFWLDAGWYTGSGGPDFNGGNWANSVGNWTVDTTRFPRGLKPLSDAAHKVGSKFMVWFEPERVMAGSLFDKMHPEWMLKLPDNNQYLFDLGNVEAREWLSNYISKIIEENGIDYYRQDFNMHASPYWEANEEPERVGIREIRHIEGLYAFWDHLLDRFPNLLIDNCASGGRRLDMETTTRSAPLWRTDYHYGETNGYQNHTYGLNFWLPLHGTGIYATDHYNARSSMSSAMVINWEINSNRVSISEMQRVIADYKKIRPYFYEDFYPLTGLDDLTGNDVWLAYQLNKVADNSGLVFAFRRKDAFNDNIVVRLSGLSPTLKYEITNENDGSKSIKTGLELNQGITLNINDQPGSLLLKYKAVP